MKKNITPLVDAYLKSLVGIKESTTDEYFYTRLKARMDNRSPQDLVVGSLQPIWIVSSMAILFTVNIYMLSIKTATKQVNATETNGIKNFADAYDQTLSSF